MFLTLSPKRQILDSSKVKEFADDSFKFYESGKMLSKQVENTEGKGEIGRYFSFSHSVFSRLVLQTCKKTGLVWERVKPLNEKLHHLSHNEFVIC